MTLRGVLIDKDGTLIDCDATWGPVIRHLAAELGGADQADAMADAAGLDLATGRLRAGSVFAAGSTRDLVALWWPDVDPARGLELARHIDATCARMGPSTSAPLFALEPFFRELERRGLAYGIATNDSLVSVRAFLETKGLAPLVPHVFGYDSVARPKPGPDMVHAFCDAAGLTPDCVAVVGDNVHDLEMARAAGAGWAVAVLSGNGGMADLEPHADVVLASIEGLPDWIDAGCPAGVWE